MKKIILSVAAAFVLFSSVCAQPVIRAANLNPVIGEILVQSYAKVKGVKVGRNGANITWNYSKLKDSAKLDTTDFIAVSGTPYASSFPSANLAAHSTSSKAEYAYYSATIKSLVAEGSQSATQLDQFLPGYTLITFPFKYRSMFVDSFTVTLTQNGSTFTEKYKDSVQAVGYGTLKLPGGKIYKNVLRVRTIENISTVVNGKLETGRLTSYDYIDSGYHYPLLTISVSSANKITDVKYATSVVTPGASNVEAAAVQNISAKQLSFAIYPNPANSAFTINTGGMNGKSVTAISVTDISGKTMIVKQTGNAITTNIPCAGLQPGIYFVTLLMSDGTRATQKLLISR